MGVFDENRNGIREVSEMCPEAIFRSRDTSPEVPKECSVAWETEEYIRMLTDYIDRKFHEMTVVHEEIIQKKIEELWDRIEKRMWRSPEQPPDNSCTHSRYKCEEGKNDHRDCLRRKDERAKYRLVYLEGMPKQRITWAKSYISEVCGVRREHIGNIEYVNEEIIEIVLFSDAFEKFMENVLKQSKLQILQAQQIISADKEGVMRRLRRIESEKVRNSDLKHFFQDVCAVLQDPKCSPQSIKDLTFDEIFETTHFNYRLH